MRAHLLIAFAALQFVCGQAAAQMSKSTIKIGVLADLSSSYQDVGGQGSVAAARLAAEEFGGTVAGARIEVVSADVQSKPDIASAIARRWFDEERVDIILDLPASNVALAVQDLARARQKISVTTGGGTTDLTGKACSPTGFHSVWDTCTMAHGPGQAIVRAGGKSWFFITGDFAAATTLEREATEAILANGGTVLGSARAPFPSTDFSSQLVRARQSGAQVGLAAADGCNAIWPYIVGFAKTKDLLFNATVLSASEALALGFVTQVVPIADLDAAVDRYVAGLLARPARALQWTKMAVNAQMKHQVWPAIESALNLLEMSNFSADHRRLLDAFEARTR